MKKLCDLMKVNRKGFYNWRNRLSSPDSRMAKRASDIALFERYHELHPNHGYRWLNAFIRRRRASCIPTITPTDAANTPA